MFNKEKKLTLEGYTLIEILVGVSIFMIILAASVNFFVSSLETQQKALASQRLLDNVSYSLDYIGRALRMAQKGDNVCVSSNTNYELTHSGSGIKFFNYQGVCQEFYWEQVGNVHSLKVWIEGSPSIDLPITPEFLDIVSFKIQPSGWAQGDSLQAKTTLFLEAKSIKSNKPELRPSIKIQTTISQRNLGD